MIYNASNTVLWTGVVQLGVIAVAVLIANILGRKVPFIRRSMMPTSVLAGFLVLLVRCLGILEVDGEFMEMLTYHGIAVGFIAMSLRTPDAAETGENKTLTGAKSGAMIVSTYLVQGLLGLGISVLLGYTFMPGLFKAAGMLLPMGYGQGPGQANNIGSSYEAKGFVGGRSFGLSLAAAGFLCACVVGVIYINYLRRKEGNLSREKGTVGTVTIDSFQAPDEIPVSESIDRFSIQLMLVLSVYLVTFLATAGIDGLLTKFAPGLAGTVSSLLWGFNFIIGSLFALLTRLIINKLKKSGIMTRRYNNNYLLSRISGVAFDAMIVAGIASINLEDLSGLWVPFLLMAVSGGVVTLFYLRWICKKVYPGFYYEGFVSMYGMMTGTISSGILLLREIDPDFKTPASNNLVTGSSFGILFGAPMLVLVGMAAQSDLMTFVVMGICVAYLALLLLFMLKAGSGKKNKG